MKIEDRIQNIKTLLKYCPHSTKDVMLYDETLADYFDKLSIMTVDLYIVNAQERYMHK